jgi:hypothetical protein
MSAVQITDQQGKWSFLNEENVNSTHWSWHVNFFYLRDVPEMLIQGREAIFWSTWIKNERSTKFDFGGGGSGVGSLRVGARRLARHFRSLSGAFRKCQTERSMGGQTNSKYRSLLSVASTS